MYNYVIQKYIYRLINIVFKIKNLLKFKIMIIIFVIINSIMIKMPTLEVTFNCKTVPVVQLTNTLFMLK